MFFDELQFDCENIPQEDVLTNDLIRKWIIAKGKACVKLDTPIYKIFPIERFSELMLTRKVAFTHPKKWDDPAEYSFISRYQEYNNICVENAKKKDYCDFYGQCWSMNKSCDGLWRTYTKNGTKLAIQVKSTIGAIAKAYINANASFLCNLFCGKVVYDLSEKLKKRVAKNTPSSIVEDLDSLFYKRQDFQYEQEVRFVVIVTERSGRLFENGKTLRDDKYALVRFLDCDWIDQCVVSPWASPMEEGLVKELAKFGGVKISKVKMSDLYEAW